MARPAILATLLLGVAAAVPLPLPAAAAPSAPAPAAAAAAKSASGAASAARASDATNDATNDDSAGDAGVVVRSGDHPGYGRVVFEFTKLPSYRILREADRTVVTFSTSLLVPPVRPPRNVVSIEGGVSQVTLHLAPGARVRPSQLGNRLVFDVLDAVPDAAAPPASGAAPAAAAAPAASAAPAQTAPAQTAPAQTGPAQTGPAQTGPAQAGPAQAGPTQAATPLDAASQQAARPQAAPSPAGPRVAAPARQAAHPQPALAQPALAQPALAQPALTQAASAQLAPAQAAPVPARQAASSQSAPAPAGLSQATPARATPGRPAPRQGGPVPGTLSLPAPEIAAATPAPDDQPVAAPPPTVLAAPLGADTNLSLAAQRVATDGSVDAVSAAVSANTGAAILVPFSREVGAASFRRGNFGLVVFDSRRPIDLAALSSDPAFSSATVQLLPDATLLTMPLAAGQELHLARDDKGWVVQLAPIVAPRPVLPESADGGLRLALHDPGHSVVVPDPMTGGNLLVGTQRGVLPPRKPGAAPLPAPTFLGQGIATVRRTPYFQLVQTSQGVAVEPLSDQLTLRPVEDGFRLTAKGADLSLATAAPAFQALLEAAALTRRFDFPNLPVERLNRQLQANVAAAAATPPRSRMLPRLAVAQSMIALGMGPEAQAVLALAAAEDPAHGDDPSLVGLSAIAALLADRPADAGGLDDPRLDGTDEIMLWRAVRDAKRTEGDAAAAQIFAATGRLLLTYPDQLRNRLLPLATETMLLGGERDAAAQLLAQRPDDVTLVFARGLLAAAQGDTAGALAVFDSLATGRDELTRVRAERQAVELRLATGALNDASAADALSHDLFGWRGDARELDLRLRIAALRARAHDWPKALANLRETLPLFPDQAPRVQALLAADFTEMLSDSDKVSPLDLVAMTEENADLVPDGPAGERVAMLLADRLEALDLPERAAPLLERMMRAAPDGAARAALGARLAAIKLKVPDAAGALSVLDDSESDGLTPELAERRAIVAARAWAAGGDNAHALSVLPPDSDSIAVGQLRAELQQAQGDWPAATASLASLAARIVPDTGALDDPAQDLLLRLASAAAQAGDNATLQRLQAQLPRLTGPRADLVRMLTETPVGGVADLPRAAQEINVARRSVAAAAAIPPLPPAHR